MSQQAERLKERTMQFALVLGWLEFIEAGKLVAASTELPRVINEARELLAIFSASAGTARYNNRNSPVNLYRIYLSNRPIRIIRLPIQ